MRGDGRCYGLEKRKIGENAEQCGQGLNIPSFSRLRTHSVFEEEFRHLVLDAVGALFCFGRTLLTCYSGRGRRLGSSMELCIDQRIWFSSVELLISEGMKVL